MKICIPQTREQTLKSYYDEKLNVLDLKDCNKPDSRLGL